MSMKIPLNLLSNTYTGNVSMISVNGVTAFVPEDVNFNRVENELDEMENLLTNFIQSHEEKSTTGVENTLEDINKIIADSKNKLIEEKNKAEEETKELEKKNP